MFVQSDEYTISLITLHLIWIFRIDKTYDLKDVHSYKYDCMSYYKMLTLCEQSGYKYKTVSLHTITLTVPNPLSSHEYEIFL